MSLKLVPPGTPHDSRTKTCALAAFRLLRAVQAKATQLPYVLRQARSDVAAAWREAADARPNG